MPLVRSEQALLSLVAFQPLGARTPLAATYHGLGAPAVRASNATRRKGGLYCFLTDFGQVPSAALRYTIPNCFVT